MISTNIIEISIIGPVQCGKSAILASIREMLVAYQYCVVIPDRAERLNPSNEISVSASHEKPSIDGTVIVLTEGISPK